MESQTFAMYAVELRDAVETFNGRRLSLSSVEQFVAAVEQVADRIAPSKVVALVGEYGYSRKVDDNGWRLV